MNLVQQALELASNPLPEGRLLAASLPPEGEAGLPGNAAVWLAAG